MTEEWLEMVRLKLREEWGAQSRLARTIGCSPSAVSALLTRPTTYSTLVVPISEALDIPLPRAQERLTEEEKDVMELWRAFRSGHPKEAELLLERIRSRLLEKYTG